MKEDYIYRVGRYTCTIDLVKSVVPFVNSLRSGDNICEGEENKKILEACRKILTQLNKNLKDDR